MYYVNIFRMIVMGLRDFMPSVKDKSCTLSVWRTKSDILTCCTLIAKHLLPKFTNQQIHDHIRKKKRSQDQNILKVKTFIQI